MASHSTPDRFRCQQQRVIFFNRVVKPVKKSSILSSMPISVCLQISWPLINWAEFLLRSRFTILSVRRSELGFRPWNAAWLFSSLQSQRRVGIQCSFKSYYSADKHFRPFSEGSEKCWKRPTSSAKKKRKLPPSHSRDWTVTIIAALITIFSHHFCHFVWRSRFLNCALLRFSTPFEN